MCACLSVSITPVCLVARVCEHVRGARCAVGGVCGARGAVSEGGSEFVKVRFGVPRQPADLLIFRRKTDPTARRWNYEL